MVFNTPRLSKSTFHPHTLHSKDFNFSNKPIHTPYPTPSNPTRHPNAILVFFSTVPNPNNSNPQKPKAKITLTSAQWWLTRGYMTTDHHKKNKTLNLTIVETKQSKHEASNNSYRTTTIIASGKERRAEPGRRREPQTARAWEWAGARASSGTDPPANCTNRRAQGANYAAIPSIAEQP